MDINIFKLIDSRILVILPLRVFVYRQDNKFKKIMHTNFNLDIFKEKFSKFFWEELV
ncbi:hypothetical protein SCHIN_v1c09650 [Spiroplasma chinense]|uniref:Uncharacterized protein n=1 Tax=Spiroplasma chinense TaxID=216932 RepID=A0A5B9Y4R4_9MOLU|nr:hypothetical protein SCHIN_v1c09650 [Spiroplasma chinense]